MSLKRFIGLLIIFFVCAPFVSGQKKTEPEPNAVEKIMEKSEGNITIEIPEGILEIILQPMNTPGKGTGGSHLKSGVNRLNGYRIQVFSDGRNQSTLESRAKDRGKAVLAKFPKYKGQVYTTSSSPNWYTRVGNFRTTEEAKTALAELKRAFPSFASEMRIVKSPIILIKK